MPFLHCAETRSEHTSFTPTLALQQLVARTRRSKASRAEPSTRRSASPQQLTCDVPIVPIVLTIEDTLDFRVRRARAGSSDRPTLPSP